jgi:transcriptional/translational regulatory protein YebC/TACO1
LASEIRVVSNKTSATIATPGSVLFNFDKKGVIHVAKSKAVEDELFLLATELEAEDFEVAEEHYIILTDPHQLHQIYEQLLEQKVEIESAELEMMPKIMIECGPEDNKANIAIIERLEDLEDIDNIYHNMEL